MRRRRLRHGIAPLAAAAALALVASGSVALHGQGPGQENPYLLHKDYSVAGPKTDEVPFQVTAPDGPEAGQNIFCYLRVVLPGPAGVWSSTVYDSMDQPWIQETGAWTSLGPVESVSVPTPLFLLHPGEFGTWTLQVRAGGLSPEVHVFMEWVGQRSECGHAPDA